MDKQLVSIVSFLLQMTKSNDLPSFQLVMSSKLQNQSILWSLPLRIEFKEGITSSGLDRKLMALSLFTKNSFKLFPEIS